MTLSVTHAVDDGRALPGPLALRVGVLVYALLVVVGNGLLNDPDTLWQITVGQWILDHRAVPETDIYSFTMQGQPWISTQWLAQVMYAEVYALAGWSGPVVLAASAIALTFALLARHVSRHLSESATLVFVAAALALTVPHLLARPHVLAMPVMVLWIGGLIGAADRREAPSFALLPLIAPVGQSAWRLRLRPVSGRPHRARCAGGRGAASAARTALGGVRLCGTRCKLRDALWLERAACVAKNPEPR